MWLRTFDGKPRASTWSASSPNQTHGAQGQFAITDIRRVGLELVRCRRCGFPARILQTSRTLTSTCFWAFLRLEFRLKKVVNHTKVIVSFVYNPVANFMIKPRPKLPTRTLHTIGECIYCGSAKDQLSKEHIIPLSLGGNLVLKKSSCADCAKLTSGLETKIAEISYKVLRSHSAYPTRRPKNVSTKQQVKLIDHFGKESEIEVPLKDAPMAVIFGHFQTPPFLRESGIQKTDSAYLRNEFVPDEQEFRRRQQKILQATGQAKLAVTSNSMQVGSLEPVLQKIAVGLFWGANPEYAKELKIGRHIFDAKVGADKDEDYGQSDYIFSLPSADDFEDELYIASLFPALEAGKVIQYASIRLFPATKSPTYFYRFGDIGGKTISTVFKSTDQ